MRLNTALKGIVTSRMMKAVGGNAPAKFVKKDTHSTSKSNTAATDIIINGSIMRIRNFDFQ